MNYRRLFIPNAFVFLTIVTENRIPILLTNTDFIKEAFLNTSKIYKYRLVAYNIQENHIHCIIKPKNISDYPKIVKSFKYSFIRQYQKQPPNKKSKVWQNRYWEHTIRDEKDMNMHLDYIHYNSTKHNNISPQNWKYSSFHKYVKKGWYSTDWCNTDDKYKINNLNFE